MLKQVVRQTVRPNPDPITLAVKGMPAKVTPMAGYYTVVYPSYVRPGTHLVRKDRTCMCELGKDCPAVQAVVDFLKNGGSRAADVPVQQLIPDVCPICGGVVNFEPRLCSKVRGAGWVCQSAATQEHSGLPQSLQIPGHTHYWKFMWTELFTQRKELQQ